MAFAMNWTDLFSIVLVGAFWGCTNPLLRKGSSDDNDTSKPRTDGSSSPTTEKTAFSLKRSLAKFRRVEVWLPYLLNQCGSLLYYKLLASSDLTFAVPVCNALSLVFSFATSLLLGERVDKPFRAVAGAAMVMTGIAICMSSRESSETDVSDNKAHEEL